MRFGRTWRWRRVGPSGPVDDAEFQGPDEPFPDHWRRFPEPWPPGFEHDDAVLRRLRAALGELPSTWRAVVLRRDVEGRTGEDVAAGLGLTVEQQRAILNRARAALRGRLHELLGRTGRR
jgi:RNA polymerase sigma-70 factor (ECF subfamily)